MVGRGWRITLLSYQGTSYYVISSSFSTLRFPEQMVQKGANAGQKAGALENHIGARIFDTDRRLL